jgi:hypothetical protein
MTKTEKPPLHRTLHDCDRELSRQRPNHSQAPDGEIWSCPCGRCFEHVCDEAEGCRWDLVTRSDATPSFPAASPAPEDQDRELVKQVQNLTMDVSLLDKIEGPVKAEHLPRAIDRLGSVLERMLDVVPEFKGGSQLVNQLGADLACLRNAAREACCRAGVSWTSEYDKERWRRLLFEGREKPKASSTVLLQGAKPDMPESEVSHCLLDEIDGPITAEHLPRAVNRMENTVIQMLESVPKFEGAERFAGQLGGEMACLRDAAREVCHQAGTHWPSERDKERLIRFFFESRASETGKWPPP